MQKNLEARMQRVERAAPVETKRASAGLHYMTIEELTRFHALLSEAKNDATSTRDTDDPRVAEAMAALSLSEHRAEVILAAERRSGGASFEVTQSFKNWLGFAELDSLIAAALASGTRPLDDQMTALYCDETLKSLAARASARRTGGFVPR